MSLVVAVLEKNLIVSLVEYKTVEEQELGFHETYVAYNPCSEPCDADYENGYVELEFGVTICITSTDER